MVGDVMTLSFKCGCGYWGLTIAKNVVSVKVDKYYNNLEEGQVMTIVFVVAMDQKACIGKFGGLPWGKPIPEDMKEFRRITLGKHVAYGRGTFESIERKPLKDRINIVLTRDKSFSVKGVEVVHSIQELLDYSLRLERSLHQDLYILGGATVYQELIPHATRMFITRVNAVFDGDAFFAKHDQTKWVSSLERTVKVCSTTPYDLDFFVLDRVGFSLSTHDPRVIADASQSPQ